uniref:Uncharacterized protein n=1 Tax=Chromera velia CCMP2878 TaxID=1169474 RepID=A0A0G4FN74_9ALVE|eukprot:Cvel_17807.t1-p1 / transcript=Cvel_17807.t1 / gene=Cvel_17807 / organism=Chromera_velia_CCMP2878 / gene_product=hypothetical protein / transcript_product=hypothetical protein / location=Cvel_scaffold1442:23901-26408(+) / protein_length=513 / sequence_SO=supercontig / SO=protein_coding / is_pseudo=false
MRQRKAAVSWVLAVSLFTFLFAWICSLLFLVSGLWCRALPPPPPLDFESKSGDADDCAQDPLLLEYSLYTIDPQCPRAVIFLPVAVGLGHQLTALSVAMDLAIRTRSTLVLSTSVFDTVEEGWMKKHTSHSPYGWIRELFRPFPNSTALTAQFPRLEFVEARNRTHAVAELMGRECSVVVESRGAMENWCDGLWCTTNSPGLLASTQCLLRALWTRALEDGRIQTTHAAAAAPSSSSSASAPVSLNELSGCRAFCNERILSVAWHVRRGDINLQYDTAFYPTVKRVLGAAASRFGYTARSFAFTNFEDHSDPRVWTVEDMQRAIGGVGEKGEGRKDLLWWSSWLDGVSGDVLVGNFEMLHDLGHITNADVLVSGGSSFAYIAAVLANASQVHVYSTPKESPFLHSGAWLTYRSKGAVPVSRDGLMTEMVRRIFYDRVERRIRVRRRVCGCSSGAERGREGEQADAEVTNTRREISEGAGRRLQAQRQAVDGVNLGFHVLDPVSLATAPLVGVG